MPTFSPIIRIVGSQGLALVTLLAWLVNAPALRALTVREQPGTEWVEVAETSRPRSVPLAMRDDVRLRLDGSSRLATDLVGRDTVQRHLAALGVTAEAWQGATRFVLDDREDVWQVTAAIAAEGRRPALSVSLLIVVSRDADQQVARLELFVPDRERFDRALPRDDGVERSALAARRNLAAVRSLHSVTEVSRSHASPLIAASGARVLVLSPGATGRPRLLAYRFTPGGVVEHVATAGSPP